MTTGQTVRLKKRFLEVFAETGNVTEACRRAGVKRRATVYEWQEHDVDFGLAFHEAEAIATEVLESEARRRAVEGVITETPLIYRGKVVRTIVETKYSDTLLIFLLKARAPEKYRENIAIKHSGRVASDQRPDMSRLSMDELDTYERLLSKTIADDTDA
jgi:hypothetical protein